MAFKSLHLFTIIHPIPHFLELLITLVIVRLSAEYFRKAVVDDVQKVSALLFYSSFAMSVVVSHSVEYND